MEHYHYDPETFEYLHPVPCQKNPARPGEYLIPPNSTARKPLSADDCMVAVYQPDIDNWTLEEDHRNKTVYSKADKSELKIETIGPIPDTHTELKPEDEFCNWDEASNQWIHDAEAEHTFKVEIERQWAMSELARSDRALTPDFPVTDEGRIKIMEYREKLRNPARSLSANFPDPSWRPQWPEGVKRPAV
ncbi:hypothetical protein [uncultured Endozoicomonas sp.]|uniref:hypothetical protein n=1 Tax=uncultured Endozoicomonas sp. TaxID=432652 RepID=UPI00262A8BB7|nr:hypothetical protein [uncultured Endozoicomonas sp.]